MTKIIHISDLHLCDEFSSSLIDSFELRERQWQTLKNVILYANEHEVDFILICGDLYEKKYFTENHAIRLLNILSKFNGFVLIISGNHDYIGDSFCFDDVKIPENIIYHVSNNVRRYDFDDYNISIFMHSWEKNLEITPKLKDFDIKNKYNLLMIHSGTNIDLNTLPLNDEDVFDKIDYVALGHIHKPGSFKRFYYPGSLEPLSIKEVGKHGGYFINIENDIKVNFIDFASIEYFDEEIDSDNMTIDDIVMNLSEIASKKIAALRLTLKGNGINFEKKELEYSLREIFKYVEIIDKREVSFDLKGIDNDFFNEIEYLIENNYSGDYKFDLKRKLYSLFVRAKRL